MFFAQRPRSLSLPPVIGRACGTWRSKLYMNGIAPISWYCQSPFRKTPLSHPCHPLCNTPQSFKARLLEQCTACKHHRLLLIQQSNRGHMPLFIGTPRLAAFCTLREYALCYSSALNLYKTYKCPPLPFVCLRPAYLRYTHTSVVAELDELSAFLCPEVKAGNHILPVFIFVSIEHLSQSVSSAHKTCRLTHLARR